MWQQKTRISEPQLLEGAQHSDSKTTTVDSWEQASRNATVVQAGAWAVLCSLTQNSKIWEYFSIPKKKKTQNDNREAQLSSQLINTSTWFWSSWSWKPYILFSSSMPPAKKLHFFPLFKQAARVMAWWTNFTSFYSVFSIFNTASSRPDGTNAIASKSIHLAAFLKWQIWWIEPRLLYKAPFQNALPGTCLL